MDNSFALNGIFTSYLVGKMIANERDNRIASEIRKLSKCGFEREAIRDLIEEKYHIILRNDFLDSYI